MKLEDLVKRVEQLIELARRVLSTEKKEYVNEQPFGSKVDRQLFYQFRTSSLSFIKNVFTDNHPYYIDFEKNVSHYDPKYVREGLGILQGVHDEFVGGWIQTIKGLVSAEIFDDFFDMAIHLLENDYKDAAAVMVGGVLEEHLRILCSSNGMETKVEKDDKEIPKKADRLNSELTKSGIYTKLDQKSITAWLDIRNKSAHGEYDEYNKEQVINMMKGVLEFIGRTRPGI